MHGMEEDKSLGSNQKFQSDKFPSKGHATSSQKATATLIKAEVPWSARRRGLSEEEWVLKKVKGILNKLTIEKFDVLKVQLINSVISHITTPVIFVGVITLIFEKAVFEPIFCPMYAQLCSYLSYELPLFPTEEPDGKEIINFKRILLNKCQMTFEGIDNLTAEMRDLTSPDQEMERLDKERLLKLRRLGNIRFIGELIKLRMMTERIAHEIVKELLGHDSKTCPAEENVEALCHFLKTIGKHLDESPNSRKYNDDYFNRLKEFTTNPLLPPRHRFMVLEILDLHSNNWVPRREEAYASPSSPPCRLNLGQNCKTDPVLRSRLTTTDRTGPAVPQVGPTQPFHSDDKLAKLLRVRKRLEKEETSRYFERLGTLGFWGQLICTAVSAVILSFSTGVGWIKITAPFAFYSTAAGIVAAFVSILWSFGYIRLSDRLRRTANEPAEAPSHDDVVTSLKNGVVLNLLGMGAAILGMQATVGPLVAKALTTSLGQSPVLALDVVLVQASANTILSHFLGLVSSLELLRYFTLLHQKASLRQEMLDLFLSFGILGDTQDND